MKVTTLGECRVRSPRSGLVSDGDRVPEIICRRQGLSITRGAIGYFERSYGSFAPAKYSWTPSMNPSLYSRVLG